MVVCQSCGAANAEGAQYCGRCGSLLSLSRSPMSENQAATDWDASSTGLAPNIAAVLSYVLGWVTGLVFVSLEKQSHFVRFHAWQSLIVFGVLTIAEVVLRFIPVVGLIINSILGLVSAALWVWLMVQAGSGKLYKLPWAGDLAEQQAASPSR